LDVKLQDQTSLIAAPEIFRRSQCSVPASR
jgi:hypothetical protein